MLNDNFERDASRLSVLRMGLQQLVKMFNTPFAYACKNIREEEGEWEIVLMQTGQIESKDFGGRTSQMIFYPQVIEEYLESGLVYQFPKQGCPIPLPDEHPDIINGMAVPFNDEDGLYAIVCLFNVTASLQSYADNNLKAFQVTIYSLLKASKYFEQPKSVMRIKHNDKHASINENILQFHLLDEIFDAVLIVNQVNEIRIANTVAAKLLAKKRSDLVGMNIDEFITANLTEIENYIEGQAREIYDDSTDKPVWHGVQITSFDGDKTLADLKVSSVELYGSVYRALILREVSKGGSALRHYRETLQRIHALTTLVPVGILQLDCHWECVYSNDTWSEYTLLTPEETRGTGWLHALCEEQDEAFLSSLNEDTIKFEKHESEVILETPYGKRTWVKVNACSLFNEDGEFSGLILSFSDVTAHRMNEFRLQEIAEKDQLTGLTNRAFFSDRLKNALRGVSRFGAVALLFIDLDEFKFINDTYGHQSGDSLLIEVARRLTDVLRQVDTVARLGGDEFTVIITNVRNTNDISAIANKVLDALMKPVNVGDCELFISCSIGIGVAQSAEIDEGSLMRQADAALYSAKQNGRNQFCFYSEDLDIKAKLSLVLRQSLKEKRYDEFRVVYQPLYDCNLNELVAFEALSRWTHPELGPVAPDKFIKIIEDSGLIDDFSEWLFNSIFETVSKWRKSGYQSLPVSINLSAKQLKNKSLVDKIGRFCESYEVEPKDIIFEVTETVVIDDPEHAAATLNKLCEMGFRLALDDFGTGYSSLLYLRKMPFHGVKIDKSFIQDVVTDDEDALIVSAIIKLVNTLGLYVIAEGVEDRPTQQWLINQNCNLHQGYYYFKPIESKDVSTTIFSGGNPVAKLV